MKNNHKLYAITLCAIFAAIIALISQIAVPTPLGIPLTFQTFAICLCGFMLGTKNALITVLVYIALGMVGMPVFYGFRGGITAVFGEITGGYIIGFIPLSALCGIRKYLYWKKNGKLLSLAAAFSGLIICHICGAAFYASLTGITFTASMALTSLPFLPKDSILLIFAFYITPKLLNAIQKNGIKI